MSWAAKSRRHAQRGYILLTLMLFFALLAIAAAAIAPTIAFQIQRDREEEMIHRGVQYSRAVRRFYKKFGRYPVSLDDLDKNRTNNMRFLRQRYKDPLTGKDFKLLHVGEVQMMGGGGLAGAMSVAAIAANQAAGSKTIAGAGSGGPGAAAQALFNTAAAGQMMQAAGPSNPLPDNSGSQDSDSDATGKGAKGGSQSSSVSSGDQLAGKVFGGGPIVGVASTSKAASIREFNQKNHYNDWQFIYDPGTDRGGLLNTPAQPALQNGMAIPQPIAPAMTGGPGAAPGMMPTQQAPGQPIPPGMQPQQ